VAELMKSLDFSNLVDRHFPVPGSNRGFKPSALINSLVLMLDDGGPCLDDLRHLRVDTGLRELLSLKDVPQADFAICTLAYNPFALMRMLLSAQWGACRATTIRWCLVALAAKVVCHGRSVTLELTQSGVHSYSPTYSRTSEHSRSQLKRYLIYLRIIRSTWRPMHAQKVGFL
jgi:hypothetical protein